jgi:coenzyme PQQ precursor peptide PqqA
LPIENGKFVGLFLFGILRGRQKLDMLLSDNSRSEWAAGGFIMEWTAPAFEEVCLNCEINSYASATL